MILSSVLAVAGESFPTYFLLVYIVGFIAAVTIGSVAWYNSKRPPGWEDAKRPDFVPDFKPEEESGSQENNNK